MSKDIDETIKKAEETLAGLDEMMNTQLNDAEQKIKKGIVQGIIGVLLTVVIYFIWGTTWFFWVSVALNVITIGGIVFAKVMIAKAKDKMSQSDSFDYDFDADILDDEPVEYTEVERHLATLLNRLEEIGEEHGEMYDTECREKMSEALFTSFVYNKEGYTLATDFGFYEAEGNKEVGEALRVYIDAMKPLAKESTEEERMDMIEDYEVESEEGQTFDDFLGEVGDVDSYKEALKI